MPIKFGDACWNKDKVTSCISNIAMLGDANTPKFLSSHAPINKILNERTHIEFKDEDLFNELLQLNKNDNLVVIYGQPGSGKSHLINWLKIRYDYALDVQDIISTVPILIRRRKGDLKDALDQLVQQLPKKYFVFLKKIHESVGKISSAEAKEKLADSMYRELGIKWREIGKEYPSRILENLFKIFQSDGFRRWLLRDGGTIDSNINRLNGESEAIERETLPQFELNEFRNIDAQFKSISKNIEEVNHLISEFEEYIEIAENAVAMCNEVLKDAIKDIIGLGGNELSNIFDDIRRELKKEDKDLLLLIEDLSTLKALDDEVLEALFPHNEDDVCKLVSVVGMTEIGFSSLAENQIGRINLIYSFKNNENKSWYNQEENYLNKFIARYLNTIRLDEDNIKKIADQRKQGLDVTISACDNCSIKKDCFDRFSYEEIGEKKIGLFPFSEHTIPNIFQDIVETTLVTKTQRGVLIYVLEPILMKFSDELRSHNHDIPNLSIRGSATDQWNQFRSTYLSTSEWEDNDRIKFIKFLFDYWVDREQTFELIYNKLKPLSEFFHLPEFSRKYGEPTPIPTQIDQKPIVTPQPNSEENLKEFNDLSTRLYQWRINNKELQKPRVIQELVLNFLKNSIPFNDNLTPSHLNAKNLLNEISVIDIVGISTNRLSNFKISFERNEENYQFFLALLSNHFKGKKTWGYAGSEQDLRTVSKWLRKHKIGLLDQFQPLSINVSKPIQVASHLLSLCYQIYNKKEIPKDNVKALEVLLNFTIETESENNFLSPNIINLKNDIPATVNNLKNFLFEQTDVPQGDPGRNPNFINPEYIIEGIKQSRKSIDISVLDNCFNTGHWKKRYSIFETYKDTWCNLANYVLEEDKEIEKIISKIKNHLILLGYAENLNHLKNEDDLILNIESFFNNIKDLVQKLKTNNLYSSSNPIFENLYNNHLVNSNNFVSEIKIANQIINEKKINNITKYNGNKLKIFSAFLEVTKQFVDEIESMVISNLSEEFNIEESKTVLNNINEKLLEFD